MMHNWEGHAFGEDCYHSICKAGEYHTTTDVLKKDPPTEADELTKFQEDDGKIYLLYY